MSRGKDISNYSIKDQDGIKRYCFRTLKNDQLCIGCPYKERCIGATKDKRKNFEVVKDLVELKDFISEHNRKLHSDKGKIIMENEWLVLKEFLQISKNTVIFVNS